MGILPKNKKVRFTMLGLVLLACAGGVWFYFVFFAPNTSFDEKSQIVLIRYSDPLENWLNEQASDFIQNKGQFSRAAALKKFRQLKPGRYRIRHGMGNHAMINMLRSGNQESINLRIDDVHTLAQLAGKLGRYLMYDSTTYMNAFMNDSIQRSYGHTTFTLPCMIIPDTYDFFWTMSPGEFLSRMKKISSAYWTEDRIRQASAIGLTPDQVSVLASIVKAETAKKEEAPKIAGLYLNRLRINMALQSDPTAVFGSEEHVARVYLSDLRNDSPYNTYLHTGLPPGPIDFSEVIYLEAVLYAEKHNFLYMCAQPGGTGYHNFSKTLDQHNVYRNEYTNWLQQKGIR